MLHQLGACWLMLTHLFYHGTVAKINVWHLVFYSNVFVYNFKPDPLASFWSLNSSKNTGRLMETGTTHTDSNCEYDWRLYSERHERSSIKSSECHTESLFRLHLTQLLWFCCWWQFLLKRNGISCVLPMHLVLPTKNTNQSELWNIT